ncbi:MAG: DoxX family protein [Pseudonocardia sp.]|nr:DoxX family protein [Pseudonocardia sp.]
MVIRRIARPLLAGVFVIGGIAELRDSRGHAKTAHVVLEQLAKRVPVEKPPSNVALVLADAGVKIGGGMLLALGKAPRLAAAALAVSLIPTTLAGHRFWELRDPEQRQLQQIQFTKNMGLLGGLMLAMVDTEGKPSLVWRAQRAGSKARRLQARAQRAGSRARRLRSGLRVG